MQNYKVIMQIDFSLSLCTNIRSSNQGSVSPSFFFYLLPLSFPSISHSLGAEIIRKEHVKLFRTHAVCVFSCDGPGLWHYAACLLITGCLALERDREAGEQGKV